MCGVDQVRVGAPGGDKAVADADSERRLGAGRRGDDPNDAAGSRCNGQVWIVEADRVSGPLGGIASGEAPIGSGNPQYFVGPSVRTILADISPNVTPR